MTAMTAYDPDRDMTLVWTGGEYAHLHEGQVGPDAPKTSSVRAVAVWDRMSDALADALTYALKDALPSPGIDAGAVADAMKRLVLEDIGEGLVPTDVASFTDLHDHVDANEYLIQARESLGLPPAFANSADTDRDNDAADLVTAWLAAGRPDTSDDEGRRPPETPRTDGTR